MSYLGSSAKSLSLTKGAKTIAEAIEEVARERSVPISFYMGGKHPYALLSKGGKSAKVFFSGTPGDNVRAAMNQRTETRKICNRNGWLAPVAEEQMEQPVNLIQTGLSKFDAVKPSSGAASPAVISVLRGFPVPDVPAIGRRTHDPRSGRPGEEYMKWLEVRDVFIYNVRKAGATFDEIVKALNGAGCPITRAASEQAVYKIERQRGERQRGQSQKRNYTSISAKEIDPAVVASVLARVPHIPGFARRVYQFGEATGEYRSWCQSVRLPWMLEAIQAGATFSKIAETLRGAGNPVDDQVVKRATLSQRKKMQQEAEKEAAKQARAAEREARKAEATAAAPVAEVAPDRVIQTEGGFLKAFGDFIEAYISAEVAKRAPKIVYTPEQVEKWKKKSENLDALLSLAKD